MLRRLKALAIFLLVYVVIGLAASSSLAHLFDLAWIALLWTFMLVVTVAAAFKAWRVRREPGGFARLGETRGLWWVPRLFGGPHNGDRNAEPRPRG
jgi:di/tricarboxylate transporter